MMLQRLGKQLLTRPCTRSPSLSKTRSHSQLAHQLSKEWKEEKANCDVTDEFAAFRHQLQQKMTIDDTSGNMQIRFIQKESKNEQVEVIFDCEDTIEDDEDEEEEDVETEAIDEAEDEDDEEELPMIAFQAKIRKGQHTLCFDCTASALLTVEKVYFEGADGLAKEESTTYTGPHFQELEEPLQEEFMKYLADRSINDELAQFIVQYAEIKEQKEYVHFLDKARSFVQDDA